jgi:hypothetical protein
MIPDNWNNNAGTHSVLLTFIASVVCESVTSHTSLYVNTTRQWI